MADNNMISIPLTTKGLTDDELKFIDAKARELAPLFDGPPREWRWYDALGEGFSNLIHRFDSSNMENERIQSLIGLSDEQFIEAVQSGRVNREDWPLGRMPRERRDALLQGKLAERQNYQNIINQTADYFKPTPHAQPEGVLENIAYHGLELVPNALTGLLEFAALGPLGMGAVSTLEGNKNAAEQVYSNLRNQGQSLDEARLSTNNPLANIADMGLRGVTNWATMNTLGRVINPQWIPGSMSPIAQTAGNILTAAGMSGAGAEATQALTNYRSGIDNDLADLAKTGLISGAQTAAMGTVSALLRARQLREAQKAYNASKPIDTTGRWIDSESNNNNNAPRMLPDGDENLPPENVNPNTNPQAPNTNSTWNDVTAKYGFEPNTPPEGIMNAIQYGQISPQDAANMLNELGMPPLVVQNMINSARQARINDLRTRTGLKINRMEQTKPDIHSMEKTQPDIHGYSTAYHNDAWQDPLRRVDTHLLPKSERSQVNVNQLDITSPQISVNRPSITPFTKSDIHTHSETPAISEVRTNRLGTDNPLLQPPEYNKKPSVTPSPESEAQYEDADWEKDITSNIQVDHFGKKYNVNILKGQYDNPQTNQQFGQYLELVDDDGQTVAYYSPHVDRFEIAPEFERTGWVHNLEGDLRKNLPEHLKAAGMLDANGQLIPDGSEDFRTKINGFNPAWTPDKQTQTSQPDYDYDDDDTDINEYTGSNNNQTQPKAPRVTPSPVSEINSHTETIPQWHDPLKSNRTPEQAQTQTPKVTPAQPVNNNSSSNQNSLGQLNFTHSGKKYNFDVKPFDYDNYDFLTRNGRTLSIVNQNGETVARYAPYLDALQFAPSLKDSLPTKIIESNLRKKLPEILKNAGMLDNNGYLIPDGNENSSFREKYKAWTPPSQQRLKNGIVDISGAEINGYRASRFENKWRAIAHNNAGLITFYNAQSKNSPPFARYDAKSDTFSLLDKSARWYEDLLKLIEQEFRKNISQFVSNPAQKTALPAPEKTAPKVTPTPDDKKTTEPAQDKKSESGSYDVYSPISGKWEKVNSDDITPKTSKIIGQVSPNNNSNFAVYDVIFPYYRASEDSKLTGPGMAFRDKNGEELGFYFPYGDKFHWWPYGIRKFAPTTLEPVIEEKLPELLKTAGLLDNEGKLIPDGYEDKRTRKGWTPPEKTPKITPSPESYKAPVQSQQDTPQKSIGQFSIKDGNDNILFDVTPINDPRSQIRGDKRLHIKEVKDPNKIQITTPHEYDYYPYIDMFEPMRFGALQSFNNNVERALRDKLPELLKAAGWLDSNGELIQDDNGNYNIKSWRNPKKQQDNSAHSEAKTVQQTQDTKKPDNFNLAPYQQIAEQVKELVITGQPLTNPELRKIAENAFGGTWGQKAFDMKDAYDAMELGLNLALKEMRYSPNSPKNSNRISSPESDIDDLEKSILPKLPTQSNRSDEMNNFQQFSTPPHIAYIVNWLANIHDGQTVLEPSAGLGGLAVFAKNAGATLFLNELSDRRFNLLKSMNLGTVYKEDAMHLADILLGRGFDKVDRVIMNPPFSSTNGRTSKKDSINGIIHLEAALRLLKPNGRLVIILGKGMNDSHQAWKHIKAKFNVRANVTLDGSNYYKFGTTFGNAIIVIDNNGATPANGTVTGHFENVVDMLDALKDVRDDIPDKTKNKAPEENINNANSGDTLKSVAAAIVDMINNDPDNLSYYVPKLRDNLQAKGISNDDFDNAIKKLRDDELITLHMEHSDFHNNDNLSEQQRQNEYNKSIQELDFRYFGFKPVNIQKLKDLAGSTEHPKIKAAPEANTQTQTPAKTTQPVTRQSDSITNAQESKPQTQTAKPAPKTAQRKKSQATPAQEDNTSSDNQSKRSIDDIRSKSKPVKISRRPESDKAKKRAEAKKYYEDLFGSEDDNSLFEPYVPSKLKIENAKPHPADLVESAAMSSISMPDITYSPVLPPEIVDKGLVSEEQLETVTYAGQAHQKFLPSGERQGFLIGDGTGVGKGTEILAIIMDNFAQGHGNGKAVWLSVNNDLSEAAKSDWIRLGNNPDNIFTHSSKTQDINPDRKGILFMGYQTLITKRDPKGGDNTLVHIEQIKHWLGGNFDGVIVLDECHKVRNSISKQGSRGVVKPAQTAVAAQDLLKEFPNARVVYASATNATEASHFCMFSRLGLWGQGTGFPDSSEFVSKLDSSGVSALEIVARTLKARGLFVSRSISFRAGPNGNDENVNFSVLEHKLTPIQKRIYDTVAKALRETEHNIEAAIKACGGGVDNSTKDSKKRGAAVSQYWSFHQRICLQLITAFKTDTIIKDIQAALDRGESVLVNISNTGDANFERAYEKLLENKHNTFDDLDISLIDPLIYMLTESFPINKVEEYEEGEGNETKIKYRNVLDSEGNPVVSLEAKELLDESIANLNMVKREIPAGLLDAITMHFGSDLVAECTTRTHRLIKKEDGSRDIIGQPNKLREAESFNNGTKRILIFSEAGATGVSYQ